MAELKTKQTDASVEDFINSVADEQRREDCRTVLKMMEKATGEKAKMWGPSIIGCGSYRYQYESGRENVWFPVGFSPRKKDLTLYLMNCTEQQTELLNKLGKHKTGKSCLYLNKLSDIDLTVLRQMIEKAVANTRGAETSK